MSVELTKDMLQLALSKKEFSQKISWLMQGFIFGPFLIYEEKKQKKQGRNQSDSNAEGDDVYPLF